MFPLSSLRGAGIELLVESLDADSIKEYSQISGKGFLTTGPRIEAGNVVTHMGIIRVTVSCSLCAIICNELFTDRHDRCPDVLYVVEGLRVREPLVYIEYTSLNCAMN
ncbi:ty3-gypsy retrotransposon protein [Cucumis melo var. makuwa]|uniref:Ty3-gypsy retrotransposon protein n=1 Tax=Cucumis melo var. makuwa TaxID=1194695 RepID=A0A5A7SGC9_CUCMM|nr:ty3-gypsy retrotransposon protein [Cucumis melo var. makuwa]